MTAITSKPRSASERPAPGIESLRYHSGFGNEHVSEALAGTLPEGQNSPQRAPRGLYAEQISGTPFTAPRAQNRRSWLYRIRPAAMHGRFRRIDNGRLLQCPLHRRCAVARPAALGPAAVSGSGRRISSTGSSPSPAMAMRARSAGVGIHHLLRDRPMGDRVFYNADGELLDRAAIGAAAPARRELGVLGVAPGEIAVIPRGVKFRVELAGRQGARLCLRELRRILPLARARARSAPTASPMRATSSMPAAAFEDRDEPTRGRREVRRQSVGQPTSITRRSTWSPGTAITRLTNTIWRASTPSER